MMRLSLSALDRLPAEVARPAYDVGAVRIGIVHLGIGAFHRAHQAVYTDDRLAAGETALGHLRREPALARDGGCARPAGRALHAWRSAPDGRALRVIGAVAPLLVAPENPDALLAAMTDPAVRIVSLTVTEKGYCHDPATGDLTARHPDIAADLAAPERAAQRAGLSRRGLAPPPRERAWRPSRCCAATTFPHNGRTVGRVLAQLRRAARPGARPLDRGRGRVSLDDGRPHRARRPPTPTAPRSRMRLGVSDAWPVDDRAVHANG